MAMVIFLKLICFFLVIFPDAFALNFNLSSINQDDRYRSINITGDAYITSEGIQITPNERNVLGNNTGRATYVKPLHLWDKSSGNLTDFTTHFTFTIDSGGSRSYADGLAFFLAPLNSSLPVGAGGSGLGLRGGNMTENNTANPFVAVEFDTFPNSWDPSDTHVGIDINSMKSVTTAIWSNHITLGAVNDAWISYNATSMNLKVSFTCFPDNKTTQCSLNYVVDLRDYLPELVTFGFSAATGQLCEKNNVISWEFNSSLQVGIDPGKKKSKAALVIGLSAGLPALILVSTLFISYVLWKKKSKENQENYSHDLFMDNEFEKGSGPKKFTYKELAFATNNFDEEEKLGEGGFGGVYKGVASALLYLHEEWERCVVHRDIKSSNIMLDSSFNAKLGDFGLARLVDHEKGSQTTVLAGTMGYMAPECVITGKANKESDVYSFGMVALEIACGRRPINARAEEDQVRTVEWVWNLYGKGKLLEAADPKLGRDFDEEEIERLMVVALWCAHPDSNLRPSIRQVIHVLNFEAELPILPSNMPVPTYLSSPTVQNFYIDQGLHKQSSSYSFDTSNYCSNFSSSTGTSSPSALLLHTN
ncbi:hypothetical protein ACH5RR_022358 [Cinchona calisaya]|uniref:non-specific serine/threonine protein kinase n=1 Tax=Cinchona calisaya TaxID=153742 RepID=A0ABD2Z9F5_9GENT